MGKRTAVVIGVVALAAAAVLLVVLITSGAEEQEAGRTGQDATTTTTAAPSTTSTTLFEQGEGPIVAVTAAGQVVLLDPDTGAQRFVLHEGIDVSDPAKNAVSISPSEGAAYVVRPAGPGADPDIVRVPLRREESAQVIANGFSPSVSPDGATLAYVQFMGTDGELKPSIVLRDLASGAETRFATPDDQPGFEFIPDVSWAPTGNLLAFTAGEIRTGLYLLDTKRSSSLADAQRLGPAAAGNEQSWFAVTPLGGRLAVGERSGDLPSRDHRILEVDLQGQVRNTIRDTNPSFHRLDSRTGGGVLLYVADVGPDGGRLVRLRPGQEPQELATGIIVAAW